MWRLVVVQLVFIMQLGLFVNSVIADSGSHYAAASELVATTYNKEAAYQNFIRFGLLPAKERYENNPKTNKYSEVLVGIVKEVLDAYFNDADTQSKLKDIYVNIYVEEFTEAEIREMIAFYKTPTGQKVLKRTPFVTKKAWERELKLGDNLSSPKYDQMLIDKIRQLQTRGVLPKEF